MPSVPLDQKFLMWAQSISEDTTFFACAAVLRQTSLDVHQIVSVSERETMRERGRYEDAERQRDREVWMGDRNIIYKMRSGGENSHHVDVLLTADAPLSRVPQFARHEAAAEWRTLYVTPTPASLSASESPC